MLTGLFWDPFDVARAITALIRDGFSEYEIDAIGVLCGRAPDLTDLLFSMGLERDEMFLTTPVFAATRQTGLPWEAPLQTLQNCD